MIDSVNHRFPEGFPRRCLLMAVGKTPQVVTETVYALARPVSGAPFVPTEVHLVTTSEGRRQAEQSLLDTGLNQFGKLCTELDLDREAISFGPDTIHVIAGEDGEFLEDIRDAKDNQCSANAVVSWVRKLTADENSALHVSLAGGRKTLGFYLGYALSLFGRPQDRLSHVLVHPGFESLKDFFFPTSRQVTEASAQSGNPGTGKSLIELADIPYVSLRGRLGTGLLGSDTASYEEIVRRTRQVIDQPALLKADFSTLSFSVDGKPLLKSTTHRAWYGFFVSRAAAGLPGVSWRNAGSAEGAAALREYLESHKIGRHFSNADFYRNWLDDAGTLDSTVADTLKTRVNTQIENCLGAGLARHYRIEREGHRGSSAYRIRLVPEFIRMTGAETE